ncbi:MAG: hypothetical protein OXK82_09775 [Deltaproteobacteria bacterium]|nr:hypothetical protein [Deltaproteobacteria bacterium]
MDTSGHAGPGGEKECAADADGDLLEQERLVDDEGVHDESLHGRCSQVAGMVDALVDLPENSRIDVDLGEDGGREALSGARIRSFAGNHRDIHDRARRNGPWS